MIVEIADHTIHLDTLLYITRYDTVVITFFGKIFVIIKGTFIGKIERPFIIAFIAIFVGCKCKKEFVKTFYFFPCLNRRVRWEENTFEFQYLFRICNPVSCWKKKKTTLKLHKS